MCIFDVCGQYIVEPRVVTVMFSQIPLPVCVFHALSKVVLERLESLSAIYFPFVFLHILLDIFYDGLIRFSH